MIATGLILVVIFLAKSGIAWRCGNEIATTDNALLALLGLGLAVYGALPDLFGS